MSMSGILSGYTVVHAYSESSSSSRPTTVNPPSWDLGIIVFAHGHNNILAFPTMFGPGISNTFNVVAHNTTDSIYDDLAVFISTSTSSIMLASGVTVSFILFAA